MPPTESLTDLGVRDAADALRRRTITSVALVEACLARVRELDPKIQAWAHLDAEGALATARERDAESAAARFRGHLHGVPVGIKDIIDVAGMPTTAGARAFAHTRPTRDATVVARLRAAGAVIIGKAHTTQFAYRDPAPTRNPWNHEHTPGGSSSGSAAAVAIRMVPCALGSQTVGSILRPAAYCGVVGLKGPHGLVPVDGIVPLGWSLDHIGPFARSVADTAVVLGVMAGREIVPASVSAPRLAVARQLFDRADAGLRQNLDAVVKRLAGAGAQVSEVTLPPEFAEIHAAGQVILESEAAAYHQNMFAKHAADYGPGFAAMMPIGLKRAAVEYVVANRARHAFRDAVIPLLEAHDALLSPTALGPAPAGLGWTGDASLCAPWSSAGVPSISIPTGLDPTGLPLALQLIQAPSGLERLLGVAAWCEGVVAFGAKPGA
jgi:Asp-tRNA(Asn)/Glu-tRNA(Gln) amidotransferase A subunit family amidase